MALFYYVKEGLSQGPVTQAELEALLKRRELDPTTLVWTQGQDDWLSADSLPGLDWLPDVPPPVPGFKTPPPLAATPPPIPAAAKQPPPIPGGVASPRDNDSRTIPLRLQPEGNYIVRHWRGELSLGQSFWVNTVVINMLCGAAFALLAHMLQAVPTPRMLLAYLIVQVVFVSVLVVWQARGCWLSAGRHTEQGGAALAAGAVRVLVVLMMLGLVGRANTSLQSISHSIDLVTWEAEHGKWSFDVSQSRKEASVKGGIGTGFAAAVSNFLEETPTLEVLHLDIAQGGLIGEAEKAAAAIEARGLVTYVSGSCVSACTLLFIAGKERYLRTGAKLGFHAPRYPGVKGVPPESAMPRLMDAAGLSPDFTRIAMATPHETMWYPTDAELLQAKVITASVQGDQFALLGLRAAASRASIEKELKGIRFYRVLEKHEPVVYAEFIKAVESIVARGGSVSDLRVMMAGSMAQLRRKYVARARPEALLEFTALARDSYSELGKISPKLCVDYATKKDEASTGRALDRLSPALRNQEIEMLSNWIESAGAVRPRASAAEMERLRGEALRSMYRVAGEDTVRDLISMVSRPESVDLARGCRAMIAFMDAIYNLPNQKGAEFTREFVDPAL